MTSVTQNPALVHVLPELPDGLAYRSESYNNQRYTTTGGFSPSSKTRSRADLRWVGVLVLDFDLVDYLAHDRGWDKVATNDRKRMMYQEFCGEDNAAKLEDLKERHLSDIETVLYEVLDDVLGAHDPTYVVDSGWGVHCYFWLEQPAATEADIDKARAVNKALVERINAAAGYDFADEGVHDTGTRILRTVGSQNTQAMEKAGIDWPMPCVVLEERCKAHFRWDLDETAKVMLVKVASSAKVASSTTAPPAPSPVTMPSGSAQAGGASFAFNNAVMWLLSGDKALTEHYEKAVADQDSQADQSLACALAARMVPASFISAVLLHKVRNHPNSHDGTDYYSRTALAGWRQVHDDASVDPMVNYAAMHEDVLLGLRAKASVMDAMGVIVQRDPRIQRMLWVDERTLRIEWAADGDGLDCMSRFCTHVGIPVPPVQKHKREFSDDHAVKLCQWVEHVYGVKVLAQWRDNMNMVTASLQKRNPVREYLERCAAAHTSDEENLLETWLLRAFPGLEDTPLVRMYSKKWLVGGVARTVDPGIFIKGMLVLIGGQSAGKSSMLRLLAGEEFYDAPSTHDVLGKDSAMACSYSWLLEMEEMDFMTKNTVEAIKKYLTTQDDKFRLPYGRTMQTFHRPCFYAGTANKIGILNDSTGNDRFWCVALPDNARCDFAWVKKHRDRVWAQAYRAWMAARDDEEMRNFAINLTMDELAVMRDANKDFELDDVTSSAFLDKVWAFVISRNGEPVLPLRISLREAAHILMPSTEDKKVNIDTDLPRSMETKMRDMLAGAGFRMMRRRLENGENPRLWYAPESWNESLVEYQKEIAASEAAVEANGGKGTVLLMPTNRKDRPTPCDARVARAFWLTK